MKKHFDNLGLPPTATISDVKKAYRKLAMRLHPDKNPTPLAAQLFTELQQSYEALLYHLDPNKPIEPQISPTVQRKSKSKEERIAEAKKRFAEQQRREQQQNEDFFQKLTNGRQWRIFKFGTVFCTLLAIVFVLDNLLPSKTQKDEVIGLDWGETGGLSTDYTHSIFLKSKLKLLVNTADLDSFEKYPTVFLQRSPILHLQKTIVHPVENKLTEYQLDWTIYSIFFLVIVFLLLPIGTYLYKTKTPRFVFSVYFNLYIVFPATILLLVLDNRWLHLMTFGFL